MCTQCHKHFKLGRTSSADDPKSGRPFISKTFLFSEQKSTLNSSILDIKGLEDNVHLHFISQTDFQNVLQNWKKQKQMGMIYKDLRRLFWRR